MGKIGIKSGLRRATPAIGQSLLHFPSAGDPGENSAKYCAIEFLNPQSDGLPIWGPGNAGVTVVLERRSLQQTGYSGGFPWWSNKGAFEWNSSGGNHSDTYWGPTSFPPDGFSGTTHNWELAGIGVGADWQETQNLGKVTVSQGTMYTQGIRIDYNGGAKVGYFYYNLPNVDADHIIQGPPDYQSGASAGFGDTNPPNPTFRFGDSAWTDFLPIERGSSDMGRVKVFKILLSQADMVSEAGDMTRLVTSAGTSNIWWGKTNWRSLDDLTCDYGTGRSFTWADSTYKATLIGA